MLSTARLLLLISAALWLAPPLSAQASRQKAAPLTARELTNVLAFTRLLGYVHYFHPSDGVDLASARGLWDRFAVQGMQRALRARNSYDLARILENQFTLLAPCVRVYPKGQGGALPVELSPPRHYWSLGIMQREFVGFAPGHRRGHLQERRLFHAFRRRRLVRPPGVSDPGQPMIKELADGLICLVPRALYTDKERTLPLQPSLPAEVGRSIPAGAERDDGLRPTRLAVVAMVWNALQHFHPWLVEKKGAWWAALPGFLSQAAGCHDARSLSVVLRRMLALTGDGQFGVLHPAVQDRHLPGIGWRLVEGQLVLTDVEESLTKLVQVGDLVLAVDGVPTQAALLAKKRAIPASPPGRQRWFALLDLLLGQRTRPLKLTVQSPGSEARDVSLARNREARSWRERLLTQGRRPAPITMLEPGIWYVDLTRTDDQVLAARVPELRKARGLVVDLRGSTRATDYPLALLTDQVLTSPVMMTPTIRLPDREGWEWNARSWKIRPAPIHLRASPVFLCDESSAGTTEIHAALVRQYHLGPLLGSTTAGSSGLVTRGRFPGGFTIQFSASKLRRADGTFFHGRGVTPTTPVQRTLAGVRAGRDEIIQRALQILRN